MAPPGSKPDGAYQTRKAESTPRMSTPPTRARTGCRTTRLAIRPQAPASPDSERARDGQNSRGPTMESKAGRRVRSTSSTMPMPMASPGPTPR